jgi:hypothetical protein
MYAKLFAQIFDSSIAEDYQVRHVFEDLLKLCDQNGVVDMTHEAIARRTNVPLEIIKRGIAELEKPDARSRNPDHNGSRLVRVDPHRDWGWFIVNYEHYRAIASEEQRREKTLARVKRHREKNKSVTPCNAAVTAINAGNAMEKQKQRQKQRQKKGEKAPHVEPLERRAEWQLRRDLAATRNPAFKKEILAELDRRADAGAEQVAAEEGDNPPF